MVESLSDFLRQKAEGRSQKAEGRRQKAEVRRQKSEGRRQKAEGKRFLDKFTFRYITLVFLCLSTQYKISS